MYISESNTPVLGVNTSIIYWKLVADFDCYENLFSKSLNLDSWGYLRLKHPLPIYWSADLIPPLHAFIHGSFRYSSTVLQDESWDCSNSSNFNAIIGLRSIITQDNQGYKALFSE